jgi:hypothetical protein
MFRGFFDDSERGDIFLIAGWVTDYDTWDRFTKDWREALDADPVIKYFKHHEAKSDPPAGQFQGWSLEQVDSKISRLVDVICRHEMYGVTAGLNTATFNAAFERAVVSKKTLKSIFKTTHYYHSCVFATHALVLQIQRDRGHIDRKVDVIFDEMSGMMAECITFYDTHKSQFPLDMQAIAGTMTEADDKEVEALQAADLLAGQTTLPLRTGNPQPEEHYKRMVSCHEVFHTPAYLPSFGQIPGFINLFNVAWATMKIERERIAALDPRTKKEPS